MKKLCFAIIFFLVIFLSFSGCSDGTETDSNMQNIQSFIERVCTVPYPALSEVATSDLQLNDPEEYDRKIRMAITSLCGEHAAIEKLSDPASRFYNQVIMTHLMADYQGYTLTAEQVEITASQDNDKQYGYRVIVRDSRETEPVILTGIVQLNDDYKIDFMSIY